MAQKRKPTATYLRTLRRDRNKTLHEVAERAGISASYLSEIERNTEKRPSRDTLSQLSDALDLTQKERDELLSAFDVETGRTRAMLFVDGRWLSTRAFPYLASTISEKVFLLDFQALPSVVAEFLGPDIEVTRKFYFMSEPKNLHPEDEALYGSRFEGNENLLMRLRDKHHYDVVSTDIDYRNFRLRKQDRERMDPDPPNPVAMALATELLFNAALPAAFDVAVIVAGDERYRPALEAVRRLGKRVALVSVKGGGRCSEKLFSGGSYKSVDWDPIWLDDDELLPRIEQIAERRTLVCASIYHEGNPEVLTKEPEPASGRDYHCEKCRRKLDERLAAVEGDLDTLPDYVSDVGDPGNHLVGLVDSLGHKSFGFIRVRNDRGVDSRVDSDRFFFHVNAVIAGMSGYRALRRGDAVEFDAVRRPYEDPNHSAGTAKNVRPFDPTKTLTPTMRSIVSDIGNSMRDAPVGASVTVTLIWTSDAERSIEDYEFTVESTTDFPIEDWEQVVLDKIGEAVQTLDEPQHCPTGLKWFGDPTPVIAGAT